MCLLCDGLLQTSLFDPVQASAAAAADMPERSEAVQAWYHAVYSAVQVVPHGKCTTYGHIARLLGSPERARQVGVCLRHLPAFESTRPQAHAFHCDNVPWQRIINARGGISSRGDGGGGASRQACALRAEGVTVADPAEGSTEATVDLKAHGWFPEALPDGFFPEGDLSGSSSESSAADDADP